MLENDLTQKFFIAIISYILGFLTCFILKRRVSDSLSEKGLAVRELLPIKENTFVLGVVTIIWALSVLVDIASPQYETSPFVHGLMGAIVGFFYKPGGEKKL